MNAYCPTCGQEMARHCSRCRKCCCACEPGLHVPMTDRLLKELYAQHEALAPRPGEIAVGGAHMDPLFRYEGVRALRLALDAGRSMATALNEAKMAAQCSIRGWNNLKAKDPVVHRWEGACDTWLEDVVKQLP